LDPTPSFVIHCSIHLLIALTRKLESVAILTSDREKSRSVICSMTLRA